MKKVLALLLALVLLSLAACGADSDKPTDKAPQLSGPTQNQPPSQTQNPTQGGGNVPTVSRMLSETITYSNSNGSLQTRYIYDDNGILLQKLEITDGNEAEAKVYIVECDAHGNPLKETCGELENTYAYNEQGQLVRQVVPGMTITYNYDPNGRPMSSAATMGPSAVVQRNIWENDVMVAREVLIDGALDAVIRFTYDAQGRIAREDVYGVDETLRSYTVYTYTDTENGYTRKVVSYNADGTEAQTIVQEYANYPAL